MMKAIFKASFLLLIAARLILVGTYLCIEDLSSGYLWGMLISVSLQLFYFLALAIYFTFKSLDLTDFLMNSILHLLFYFCLLLHILFCINMHKSHALQRYLSVSFNRKLYLLQLIVQLLGQDVGVLAFVIANSSYLGISQLGVLIILVVTFEGFFLLGKLTSFARKNTEEHYDTTYISDYLVTEQDVPSVYHSVASLT